MSFLYITGPPGSGKSTLQKILSAKKMEVHDIDDPTLGGAHNKSSGKRVTIPPAQDRPPEWYNEHEWRIDFDAIESLKERSSDKTIVICGVAPDDERILDLFNKIFYLKINDENLKERIAARSDNDYGKNPDELTVILERKKKLDARYTNSNALIIDASLPPNKVADQILANID